MGNKFLFEKKKLKVIIPFQGMPKLDFAEAFEKVALWRTKNDRCQKLYSFAGFIRVDKKP